MSEVKQRHGCLTAFLVVAIIGNAVAVLLYIFATGTVLQSFPGASPWTLVVLAVVGILNIVCLIALFKWKKWGFYAALVFSFVTFAVNLVLGVGIIRAILGFIGIAILYGVLQIGGPRKGWTQLE